MVESQVRSGSDVQAAADIFTLTAPAQSELGLRWLAGSHLLPDFLQRVNITSC